MGYFSRLADHSFIKNEMGEDVFYPYGILGTGYEIECKARLEELKSIYAKLTKVVFIGIVTISVVFGVWGVAVVCPIYAVWHYLFIKKLTRDMSKTSGKIRPGDAMKNSAQIQSVNTLVWGMIGSVLFIIACVYLLYTRGIHWQPIAGLVFFGVGVFVFGRVLYLKLNNA